MNLNHVFLEYLAPEAPSPQVSEALAHRPRKARRKKTVALPFSREESADAVHNDNIVKAGKFGRFG